MTNSRRISNNQVITDTSVIPLHSSSLDELFLPKMMNIKMSSIGPRYEMSFSPFSFTGLCQKKRSRIRSHVLLDTNKSHHQTFFIIFLLGYLTSSCMTAVTPSAVTTNASSSATSSVSSSLMSSDASSTLFPQASSSSSFVSSSISSSSLLTSPHPLTHSSHATTKAILTPNASSKPTTTSASSLARTSPLDVKNKLHSPSSSLRQQPKYLSHQLRKFVECRQSMHQLMMSMTTTSSPASMTQYNESSHDHHEHHEGSDKQRQQPLALVDDNRHDDGNDRATDCEPDFDGITCWPPTPVLHIAQVPCPDFIADFDPNKFVSRSCLSNGSWSYQGNYSSCGSGTLFHPDKINTPSERILLERLIEEVSKLDSSPFDDARTTMAFEECIDNVLSKPLPPEGTFRDFNQFFLWRVS